MKKILYIIGVMLLFTSCSKYELTTHEQETIQKSFNLTIEEPDYALESRATVTIGRYMLEMYEGNLSATPLKLTNSTGKFEVVIKKGTDYICLIWADNGTSYNVVDLKAVNQISETKAGTAAYFANVTINSKSEKSIVLKRAVAELSFIDKNGLTATSNTLKITYPYSSATFNLVDGTVTHVQGTTERTITGIIPPTTATNAFATDFILAPTTAGNLTDLKFQLNSEAEKSINKTAIKANVKTKITGEYEMIWPSMSFTINTSKNTNDTSDKTFIIPLNATISGYSLKVDWGDGSTVTFASGTTLTVANMKHAYDTAGQYTITISSSQKDPSKMQMPKLDFYTNYGSENRNSSKLISLDTPLLNIGTSLSSCFRNCTGLTGPIPAWLFTNNTNAINFSFCFSDCSGLTSEIPAGLFTTNTSATDFSSCFRYCTGLTGAIPAGLFTKNTSATNFSTCFSGCTRLAGAIPAGLFTNNTSATNFGSCFGSCTGLTGAIPEGLFTTNTSATNFSTCFSGCTGLTDPIPAGLFTNNTSATNFGACFDGCTGLPGPIPEGLFTKNTKAKNFSSCFNGCTGLTGAIPQGLFTNNTEVTDFSSCFSVCEKLTGTIPAGLFTNNTRATNFSACFYDCTGLTGTIPQGLFTNNTEVTDFSSCFCSCAKLTGPIPAGLFTKNIKTKNFSSCFSSCTNLTGPIPAGLFTYNVEAENFKSCFSACSSISEAIPSNLFANNTKATNFNSCFLYCSSITGMIPEGMFKNNLLAIDFGSCFQNCVKSKLNPNIFCDERSQKATRFANKTMNFADCFNACGLNNSISLGAGGTAPALWDYTMNATSNKTRCFRNVTKVDNVNSITAPWK